jgi:hypothetical protein
MPVTSRLGQRSTAFAQIRNGILLLLVSAGLSLQAQAPEGWNHAEVLGADLPLGTEWLGAGTWAARQSGPPATLISSLGLGNSLTGTGLSLEGGLNRDTWSVAFKVLAFQDTTGATRLSLYQGHATWNSEGGWHLGLEDEPLVWGYGLTGGYLLGEAARPFPRLKVQTPKSQLHLFNVPLGIWDFQWFTGRLENGRRIADNAQIPSLQANIIAANGEPQAPLFSGYRVEATFFERRVEYYANWTVLWGGTRNGVSQTSGDSFSDYLKTMTGLKDPLAESSIDFSDPNHPPASTKLKSSTNFDMGLRAQIPPLARFLGADKAWGYVSRGTKGMTLRWALASHKPLYYLGKDLERDGRFLLNSNYRGVWYNQDRYLTPNMIAPDDTFGLLFQWPDLRVGLERRSTANLPSISYRSFVNNIYATGFYRDGDPLGEALGGEADFTTLKTEWDATPRFSTSIWLLRGVRPFRDDPTLWALAHPGKNSAEIRFLDIQGDLAWHLDRATTLRGGWAWEHRSAENYVQGQPGNGFRYFLEYSTRFLR